MSVDIFGTGWDQCVSMVQKCPLRPRKSRLVRTENPGQPPRLSHSSWALTPLSRLSPVAYKKHTQGKSWTRIGVCFAHIPVASLSRCLQTAHTREKLDQNRCLFCSHPCQLRLSSRLTPKTVDNVVVDFPSWQAPDETEMDRYPFWQQKNIHIVFSSMARICFVCIYVYRCLMPSDIVSFRLVSARMSGLEGRSGRIVSFQCYFSYVHRNHQAY